MKKLLLVLALLCITNNVFAKGEKKLFKAVQDSDLLKIEELLTKGANINSLDKAGYSPLRYAIKKNDINLVTFLIEKGADVNFKYKSGGFPLATAVGSSNEKIDINIFKLLLDKGADVNAKTSDANTALVFASLSDSTLEVAKIFIEEGVDVNAKNKYEFTALDYAINKDSLEVAKLLLSKGGLTSNRTVIWVYNVNVNDYGYFNTTLEEYDFNFNLVNVSRPHILQKLGSDNGFTMKEVIERIKEYMLTVNFIETKIIDSNNFMVIFGPKIISLLKK